MGKQITTEPGCFACGPPEEETHQQNTSLPRVWTSTFLRNPPSWLYVVNSLLILSNISRNICSFLFFLCRQCVPPHPQLVPPQEFHVHALENENHPPSPHVLIHRREASDTTSSNQHCTSRARTRPLPPLLPRGTDPQPESKALQRKGM